ncbi:hypothetical protein [Streptomyces murinus]|uniref:hypothetical protein n=1 Tax=Streptomyces murinus TaxID=33900 RepID=UPI003829E6C8
MTKNPISGPRAPASGESLSSAAEPPGLTTFSAALTLWKNTLPEAADRSPGEVPAPDAARPRLLHDRALPEPPPGLPDLATLQNIVHTAADRARRVLAGVPLPDAPLADAVHIADTASVTDPTPAYRLDVDLGHWRELLSLHRTRGCATDGATGSTHPVV